MKILVCIDHMESGGAARVTSVMCNGLAQRGYTLVLAYNTQRETRYELNGQIQRIDNSVLRRGKSHWAGVKLLIDRVVRYKQLIREIKPDIIIGVEPEPYLYARLATMGEKTPVVAVDHTSYRRKQHWFIRWIRWKAYRWADSVSILSHTDEHILGKRLPKKTVIYNPLPFPVCETEPQREKIVLCVGRRDAWEVKGFDRMLRIWENIVSLHPDWKLVFAGLTDDSITTPQVEFLGARTDMQNLYQKAAIFALPSRIEGFPMSLLEAGSQGCACIAFALGGVTKEIYTDGKSGIIIEDNNESAFADQLSRLMNSSDMRKDYSKAIREEIRKFTAERFIDTWEQLLQHLCSNQ